MPDPYRVKRHDTAPPLRATLRQADKTAIPLGGAEVEFRMRPAPGGAGPTIAAACVVTDEPGGKVEYRWQPGDTAQSGVYRAEFEITFPDSSVQTVPTEGWIDVVVVDDLG